MTVLRRAVEMLVVAAVAGGGAYALYPVVHDDHGPAVVTGTVTAKRPPAPIETAPVSSCTVGLAGTDVKVTLDGPGAERSCDVWIRDRSNASAYWSFADPPPEQAQSFSFTCRLAKDGLRMTVWDSGGHAGGHAICGEFTGRGWEQLPTGE